MSRQKLVKTKYTNIFKTTNNTYYFRKKLNNKNIVRKLGSNITIKEALILSIELEKEILKPPTEDKDKLFKEVVIEYIELNKNLYSNQWVNTQNYSFNKLIKFNNYKIKDITVQDIQPVINQLLKRLKPASVDKVKQSLSALLNYYKLPNIAKDIKIPKYDNSLTFKLTEKEIEKLKETIFNYTDLKLKCFFLLGLSGRRKGEISKLKWCDIDLDNSVINIKYDNSKNRKNSTYPILDFILVELKKYKESIEPKESDFVFTSANNTPLYWVQGAWKRLCNSVGIDIRFHDLRHLIGYIAINKGYSLEQIAATLGHSSIRTTTRYSKLKENTAREVLTNIL